MRRRKKYSWIENGILNILAEDGCLTKNQVFAKLRSLKLGGYPERIPSSTFYKCVAELRKQGFIEEKPAYVNERIVPKIQLTILGFIFLVYRMFNGKKLSKLTKHHIFKDLYQTNHGWIPNQKKLIQNYWHFLIEAITKDFKENFAQYSPIEKLVSQVLVEVFKNHPEEPPVYFQTLLEDISKSMMRKLIECLTLEKNLDEISQMEINSWVLEGVYEGFKKYFRMGSTPDFEQLASLMSNSFQKLAEEDKLMVIQTFKMMVHNMIYQMVKKHESLKRSFIEKVKQAEAPQIVYPISCPHCSYNGFSIQDGFSLLSNFFLPHCEKCKKPIRTWAGLSDVKSQATASTLKGESRDDTLPN
ncbi:MAG: hypothetical protein QW629_00895 [Candidatus Bathyarchaeia archaeon]